MTTWRQRLRDFRDWKARVFDWRDPEMPVMRRIEDMAGNVTIIPIDEREEQQHRQDKMTQIGVPNWRNDPTYDLKAKKKT